MKLKTNWISYLRIVATLAVVWLHTNGTLFGNQDLFYLTESQIKWFSINYYLMKWAVPIFLMITGFLLLQPNKMITVKDCLTRYARRQLIAIVIFGTMYSAMIIASSGTINIMIIPKAIWGGITGNTFSHLWYCFMLIGVYLILPVLKSFIDKAEDKDLEYLLFVLFVFDFIIPCINLLLDRDIQFNIPFTYVLFYVICGYYIGKKEVKSIIYGIASVVSIICIGILAYMNPVINLKYLDYDSPIVALLAIGIFGMAKCVCTKKKIIENTKIKTTTWEIDRLCFGVYLMHPLFIQVFYRIIGITPIRFKIYQIGTVITFIVVVILAFVFSWIMRKIPFMKNYVL